MLSCCCCCVCACCLLAPLTLDFTHDNKPKLTLNLNLILTLTLKPSVLALKELRTTQNVLTLQGLSLVFTKIEIQEQMCVCVSHAGGYVTAPSSNPSTCTDDKRRDTHTHPHILTQCLQGFWCLSLLLEALMKHRGNLDGWQGLKNRYYCRLYLL